LDRLHDDLDPNNIVVHIEILNNSIVGCLCIRHFRSFDGWVSNGNVSGRSSRGTHHVDTTFLDDWVLVDAVPNLMVVFNGVSIDEHSR
jgi:hypothetical protein